MYFCPGLYEFNLCDWLMFQRAMFVNTLLVILTFRSYTLMVVSQSTVDELDETHTLSEQDLHFELQMMKSEQQIMKLELEELKTMIATFLQPSRVGTNKVRCHCKKQLKRRPTL